MKTLFLFLCLIPFCGFAQEFTVERPDEKTDLNPYKSTYFADNNNYENIVSITSFSKNKANNFKTDTSNIKFYNEKGLCYKSIRYNKNRPYIATFIDYNNANNITSWCSVYPNSSTKVFYFYNDNQQVVKTRQVNIKPINGQMDTIELSKRFFSYDKNEQLIKIQDKGQSRPVFDLYQYEYENGQLSKMIGGTSKLFTYDDAQNVATISEYIQRIDPKMLMSAKKMVYDDNKNLIMDSVVTTANRSKGLYQITNYTYNNDQLETMKVSFDALYRNVQFEYLDNKIKKITVETNGNSAYLRFWISPQIDQFYSFPIKYQEIFEYDKFGNKTAKRDYVNGELFSETQFNIEYRK